jgi:hypothetical protein
MIEALSALPNGFNVAPPVKDPEGVPVLEDLCTAVR